MRIDPYLQWLEIPADRRPPTHYDLLGLQPLDFQPARVQEEASRRIAHVRKYQVGAYGEIAQQVINELSQALACLSDDKRRAAYDREIGGLATLAERGGAMDTWSDATQPASGVAPPVRPPSTAPIDLAGTVSAGTVSADPARASLNALSALVQMTDQLPADAPPPMSEIPVEALSAAQQEETDQRKFLALVCGGAAVAMLLVAALGAWLLKDSPKDTGATTDAVVAGSTSSPDQQLDAGQGASPEAPGAVVGNAASLPGEPPPAVPSSDPLRVDFVGAQVFNGRLGWATAGDYTTLLVQGDVHVVLRNTLVFPPTLIEARSSDPAILFWLGDCLRRQNSGQLPSLFSLYSRPLPASAAANRIDAQLPQVEIERIVPDQSNKGPIEASRNPQSAVAGVVSPITNVQSLWNLSIGQRVNLLATYWTADEAGQSFVVTDRIDNVQRVTLQFPAVQSPGFRNSNFRARDLVLVGVTVVAISPAGPTFEALYIARLGGPDGVVLLRNGLGQLFHVVATTPLWTTSVSWSAMPVDPLPPAFAVAPPNAGPAPGAMPAAVAGAQPAPAGVAPVAPAAVAPPPVAPAEAPQPAVANAKPAVDASARLREVTRLLKAKNYLGAQQILKEVDAMDLDKTDRASVTTLQKNLTRIAASLLLEAKGQKAQGAPAFLYKSKLDTAILLDPNGPSGTEARTMLGSSVTAPFGIP